MAQIELVWVLLDRCSHDIDFRCKRSCKLLKICMLLIAILYARVMLLDYGLDLLCYLLACMAMMEREP